MGLGRLEYVSRIQFHVDLRSDAYLGEDCRSLKRGKMQEMYRRLFSLDIVCGCRYKLVVVHFLCLIAVVASKLAYMQKLRRRICQSHLVLADLPIS